MTTSRLCFSANTRLRFSECSLLSEVALNEAPPEQMNVVVFRANRIANVVFVLHCPDTPAPQAMDITPVQKGTVWSISSKPLRFLFDLVS